MMHEPPSPYRQTPEPEEPQRPTGKWPLFKARHPELARMVVGFVVLMGLALTAATLTGLSIVIGLFVSPGPSIDEAFKTGAFTLASISVSLFVCYILGAFWSFKT